MRIQIVTPAPRGSRAGNRVTANRWAKLLRSLGHDVHVTTTWDGAPDVLVALHARRSHESIRRFHDAFPDRPLIVVLTGTDVYRDIHQDDKAVQSLRVATSLVVLQAAAIRELPRVYRTKARVVLQSAEPRRRRRKRKFPIRLVSVGHLRAEKDPFRMLEALSRVPDLPLNVLHAGAALTPNFERAAKRWMRRERRYRWLGEISTARSRQIIANADALVLSSLLEGGANVISEAVVCSVPVLASRIPSSVALLGDDYSGYFEAGNAEELSHLIRRFVLNRSFRRNLTSAVQRLRPRFRPAAEREALRDLLREATS